MAQIGLTQEQHSALVRSANALFEGRGSRSDLDTILNIAAGFRLTPLELLRRNCVAATEENIKSWERTFPPAT